MLEQLADWANERTLLLWSLAVVSLLLAGREWLVVRQRSWALRLRGLDLVDAGSGAHSFTAAASVILPAELSIARTTGRKVCLLLVRVENGDPATAARFLADRSRRYEHVARIEYQLVGCLLLVRDRAEAVRAAARLLEGFDEPSLPFDIREAAVAMAPDDAEEFVDLVDRAATRFAPIERFAYVADLAARVPVGS